MCCMQIQWAHNWREKTINTEEKVQKQWWRVKHTDKKNKRGNKNVVKKSISMGNILAVVLLTALFATLYFLGSVRI